ncbi:Predicted dioxygenase of extradiol dioxygenase family [Aliiroseovarius halocynthiae]|uniref:Glyoxalase n=2 Tax=Aliiroseovarius halocynthiae TaxID=985055 RepID=A0A545SRP7_9RHOB|nr:glyoxalase [Aliiroseovarius halocynthiae]SMR81606.1 Predicted dioxygenase of extradiol dioxygenase family [Aliiroseovarius halocynthiae]
MLTNLHHVQLSMPAGQGKKARAFYGDVLGMDEEPKPEPLASRGGVWFQQGAIRLHLGVETPFSPARKAHPAMCCDQINRLAERLLDAGYAVRWDDNLPGMRRFYTDDPFGNRIEILSAG